MADQKSVLEFLEVFSGNEGGVVVFVAAAKRGSNLGIVLVFWLREEIVGHIFDEDAFALDLHCQ